MENDGGALKAEKESTLTASSLPSPSRSPAITASGLASIFMRGALKPAERGSRYDVGNRDPIAAALRAGEVPTPDVQDSAIAVGQRVKKRADAASTTSGDDSARPS